MESQLINFRRCFQVWAYSVSHSQLLLRSNRTNKFETRVDVLFKGVAAMELATILDGLSIIEVSGDDVVGLNIQLGPESVQDRKVFVIRSSNFAGYVVALTVTWHEDRGYHYDRSYFQDSFGDSARL